MGRQFARVVGILCTVLLLCVAVGGVSADTNTTELTVETQDTGGVVVSESVEDSSGEAELVVRFSAEAAGMATATEESGTVTTSQLQERAVGAQAEFRQFATQRPGVTVENRFWLTNAALVRVDTDQTPVSALARVDGVERIMQNYEIQQLDGGQSEPETATEASARSSESTAGTAGSSVAGTDSVQTTYGLAQVNATDVWTEYGTRGGGASVAVLDTGVDPDHPDIDLTGWQAFNSDGSENSSPPKDFGAGDGSHGTHVSGTVAGGNASGRYIGVAPNATLLHGAVLTDCSSGGCIGSFAQIIAGMQWAMNNNADVLSMSLGANGTFPDFINPVRNAESMGTTVIASAGNSGQGTSGSPGNVYNVTSVGASNNSKGIASFSSGEQIDTSTAWGSDAPSDWPEQYTVPSVSAPGVFVESALNGGNYGFKSGTSMAAPHVSGAAALIESATEYSLSPEDVETALEETASKPAGAPAPEDTRDTRYGRGIIDVPAAIEFLEARIPENLSVSVSSTNTPVPEGETLSVDVQVTNTGELRGNQSIQLDAGPLGTDSVSVSVAGGASTTETLSVGTSNGDNGSYTVQVSSQNDSTSTGVTVDATSNFDVAILSTNNTDAGGNLSVTADVTNVGDAAGTQTVGLFGGPLGSNTTTLSLGSGSSQTVEMSVSIPDSEYGNYSVDVSSANDTSTQNVSIELPPVGGDSPGDPGGDGQYEDIDGDGGVNIIDIQALFTGLEDGNVQDHPQAFSFSPASPSTEVTILDVAAHWRTYVNN